jgi:hypothetical protein
MPPADIVKRLNVVLPDRISVGLLSAFALVSLGRLFIHRLDRATDGA